MTEPYLVWQTQRELPKYGLLIEATQVIRAVSEHNPLRFH
jgi:hypothetical protein